MTTEATAGRMMPGYAYQFDPFDLARSYYDSSSEDWDTVIYSPTGRERYLMTRRIDGCPCRVYQCEDGKIRAQTVAATEGRGNLTGWARL